MQSFKITVAPPLEIIPMSYGYHIRDASKRDFWAKITGQCDVGSGSVAGSGSSTCRSCFYSWVEIVEGDDCESVESNIDVSEFDLPAVEITGRDDVPIGAVVRLYPSRQNARYTFQYTSPPVPCADDSLLCFRADTDPRCFSGNIISDDSYLVIPQCVADAWGIYVTDINPCDTGSGS